jgi:hypothetical protein
VMFCGESGTVIGAYCQGSGWGIKTVELVVPEPGYHRDMFGSNGWIDLYSEVSTSTLFWFSH